MIKFRKGSIINISSTSAEDNPIGRSGYSASKAGMISITKTLAYELGPYNIRANCVLPGLTETEMMRNNTNKDIVDEVITRTALKRIANPKEIAKVVLFLASEEASYITAQSIRVDGGMYS